MLEKLKKRMSKIRVGDPMDKNTDLGAINSKEQLLKIRELSASGDAEGAQRWSAPCELPAKGFWFAPTIFTGIDARPDGNAVDTAATPTCAPPTKSKCLRATATISL